MMFPTISFIAFVVTTAVAMPNGIPANDIEARGCNILPACNGGHVVGQTNCRCPGQKETCDLWSCPGSGANTVMVCGQAGTGCVWI